MCKWERHETSRIFICYSKYVLRYLLENISEATDDRGGERISEEVS